MGSIIDLLNDKNNCLEKFYRLNEAQLENLCAGHYESLDVFYSDREGLLAIIKKLDELIEKSNEIPIDATEVDASIRQAILGALQYKNNLVNRILEQDLEILSAIEEAKSRIIKELSQVRATKKALGSYKSGRPSGTLDEEV